MIVKSIYSERLDSLKKKFNDHKEYVINQESRIREYQDLLDSLKQEVEQLNNDKNLDVNIKYIKINEKLKLVSEITEDYTSFYTTIVSKRDDILKEFNIIVQNIASDNKCSEKEVKKSISLD